MKNHRADLVRPPRIYSAPPSVLLPITVATILIIFVADAGGLSPVTVLAVAAIAIVACLGIVLPNAVVSMSAPVVIIALVLQTIISGVHLPTSVMRIINLLDDCALICATPMAAHAMQNENHPLRLRYGIAILITAPVVGVVGAVERGIEPEAILTGFWLTEKPLIALAVGISALTSKAQLRRFLRVLGGIAVVVLAFGIFELLAPQLAHVVTHPTSRLERIGIPVVRSFFPGPQAYGFFMLISGATLWLSQHSRGRQRFLGLLLVVSSMLSLRVKSLGQFAATLVIGSALAPRNRRASRSISSGILVIVVVAIAWGVITQLVAANTSVYFSASSDTAREKLYHTSFSIAQDYFPLGTGTGSFGSHASIAVRSPVYAEYGLDNDYGFGLNGPSLWALDTSWPPLLAENGLLGVALLLCGAYCVFRRKRDDYAHPRSLRWTVLSIVMIGALASARLYDPMALAFLGWIWSRRVPGLTG